MGQTNVNIRMDKDIKDRAERMFNEMGMSMTTAFNIFVRQALRQGKIPFEIAVDPFYSDSNMKVLRRSIREAVQGVQIAVDPCASRRILCVHESEEHHIVRHDRHCM